MGRLYIAVVLAFAIDQISKQAVVFGLDLVTRLSIDVLPPLLNFRYGENRGINFGLLDGDSALMRWVLVGFTLIIIAGVYYWVARWHRTPLMLISAGLLIGGALGNLLDRLLYGYVLDFLNMSCCGINNPFVFNVADIFIFAGAVGLVLFDSGSRRKNAP